MPRESFYVNSLGETPHVHSINVCALETRLSRVATDGDYKREFKRLSRMHHTAREHKLYLRHYRLTEKFATGLWRFNSKITARGCLKSQLCTEFRASIADSAFWKGLRAIAREHGLRLNNMWQGVNNELSWAGGYGKPRRELWIGSEHRLEVRQVSVKIDVMTWTDKRIARLIREVDAAVLAGAMEERRVFVS